MERSFIISKESKYYIDYEKHLAKAEEQREFVIKFFNEKSIEANKYIVGGDGFVNKPFSKYEKSNVTLSIDPTENDLNKFGKMLTKPNHKRCGLCSFKKNSTIAKEFAQKCVDEKIVINLWKPRIGDYFQSLGFYGCGWQRFSYNDTLYIKVQSDYLKSNDTPDGFIEIKLSEYYKAKEEYDENCNEKYS